MTMICYDNLELKRRVFFQPHAAAMGHILWNLLCRNKADISWQA